MKSDIPYAVAIIFAAVCFAIGLMIWSLAGTSGGRQVAITTGTSTSRQTETPTPAPGPLTNDARASSTRATKGPTVWVPAMIGIRRA